MQLVALSNTKPKNPLKLEKKNWSKNISTLKNECVFGTILGHWLQEIVEKQVELQVGDKHKIKVLKLLPLKNSPK
jgi:hypothetical protein